MDCPYSVHQLYRSRGAESLKLRHQTSLLGIYSCFWRYMIRMSDILLARQGVGVAAYGAVEFPAFFTRRSGCRAPLRIDTPEEGAALIRASLQLDLHSGMVIGARPPSQAHEGLLALMTQSPGTCLVDENFFP